MKDYYILLMKYMIKNLIIRMDNNIIKINENDIEKEKKNSDCVRNRKNKK